MERPARPFHTPLLVERVRDRPRIRIDLDDRPQRRTLAIDLLDPREVHVHDPARGVAAGLHALLQLSHRRLLELEAGGLLCVGDPTRRMATSISASRCMSQRVPLQTSERSRTRRSEVFRLTRCLPLVDTKRSRCRT